MLNSSSDSSSNSSSSSSTPTAKPAFHQLVTARRDAQLAKISIIPAIIKKHGNPFGFCVVGLPIFYEFEFDTHLGTKSTQQRSLVPAMIGPEMMLIDMPATLSRTVVDHLSDTNGAGVGSSFSLSQSGTGTDMKYTLVRVDDQITKPRRKKKSKKKRVVAKKKPARKTKMKTTISRRGKK